MSKYDRTTLDKAIANMTVQSSAYSKEYMFYLHLLSQCKIVFDPTLRAAAGVSFQNDHYVLYLNPSEIVAEGEDDKGNKITVEGFNALSLEHSLGVLKHEMLHIALGHLIRGEELHHEKFNMASDCALNQDINREHLPSYAIYPDNFPVDCSWDKEAEYYYELLKEDEENARNDSNSSSDSDNNNSSNNGNSSSDDSNISRRAVGDHSKWKESKGDPTLQKELTKNMVERAANETVKQKGNLPSSYSAMIENLTVSREVNWKQLLRKVVGNKKVNNRKTIMRRDRRLPHAAWLKGRTKDRIFELGVISDVSGSVSDAALYKVWGEIIHICELLNTPINMVQIDTRPREPISLTRKTKVIERTGNGGTYLSPAISEFNKHKTNFDALVITTDGHLFDGDIDPFYQLRKPVIWLIEPDGQILPEMSTGKMRAVQLKKE